MFFFSALFDSSAPRRRGLPGGRLPARVLVLTALLGLLLTLPGRAQGPVRNRAKHNPINQGAASYNSGVANHTGYGKGVGLRIGAPVVATIRAFKGKTALEGMAGGRFATRGFYLGALLEQHFDVPGVLGLRWFVGVGGHVFSYKGKYFYDYHASKEERARYFDQYEKYFKGLVPDAILGLEYQLHGGKPWAFGIDVKPCYERVNGTRYFFPDPGLTARYIF